MASPSTGWASADDLTLHRRAMAGAPVLSREAQGALFRRLRVERDAFESASLEAPEIVQALLQRWQRLREAGRSTGGWTPARPPRANSGAAAQIRYRRAEEALRAATPGEPGRSDLAARLGLAPDEVDRIAASAAPIASTDAPLAGSDDLALESILVDEACVDPAAVHDQRVLESSLPAMLATLGERERALLVARFGLDGSKGATLSEVGARFGLSRERVRQIEARALARMRAGPVARSLATWRSAATASV